MKKTNLEIIHKWVAETDLYISRQRDIDRAMVWVEEYLRHEEIIADYDEEWWIRKCKTQRPTENVESVFDYLFDTCVRYLEKVELERGK